MTNVQMTNDETEEFIREEASHCGHRPLTPCPFMAESICFVIWSFVIRTLIRHSNFVIRILPKRSPPTRLPGSAPDASGQTHTTAAPSPISDGYRAAESAIPAAPHVA